MKWLIDLIKAFFSSFLEVTVEEIKKPDEGHFIGGDKELIDGVNNNITESLIGGETTVIINNSDGKESMNHG